MILLAAVAASYLLVLKPQQQALPAAEQAATSCAQQVESLRGRVSDLTIIRDQLH